MAFQYQVTLDDSLAPQTVPTEQALIADANYALSEFQPYISGQGTLVVNVVIKPGIGIATGGATVDVRNGAVGGNTLLLPSSINELLTGQHVAGYASDITVQIDPSFLQNGVFLNPTPGTPTTIPADRLDAVSMLLHEIDHGFGQSGFRNQSGALAYPDGTVFFVTKFDTLIQSNPDGTAFFTGPKAEAANGGKPVQLTTGTTDGENYYHFAATPSDPNAQDVMTGLGQSDGRSYTLSPLDIAVMQDDGVPIISTPSGGTPPVTPPVTPPATGAFTIADTTTGQTTTSGGNRIFQILSSLPDKYVPISQPTDNVTEYQNITADNLNITAATNDVFISTAGPVPGGIKGNDNITLHGGDFNYVDAGAGNNVITSGSGHDTFFVDDNGTPSWAQLMNFHTGDTLVMFGITPPGSSLSSSHPAEFSSVNGVQGLSFGWGSNFVTIPGYSAADLQSGGKLASAASLANGTPFWSITATA